MGIPQISDGRDVMPQRKLMTSLMPAKLSNCAVLFGYATLATRKSARRAVAWHCCLSRRDGQYVGARQMPTLRSSTFSTELLPECASHVSITADAQRDPVSLTDQKKQAENLKPKSRPAGRKRLRPVALADEPVNEAAKIASGPDVAARPAAVKKLKVRKALLTTLWTEEDLLALKVKAERVYNQLNQLYKDPPCPLIYQTPFQLLVAVILSAQVPGKTDIVVFAWHQQSLHGISSLQHVLSASCVTILMSSCSFRDSHVSNCSSSFDMQTTDKKVNEVTPALFELAPDAARMANMEVSA